MNARALSLVFVGAGILLCSIARGEAHANLKVTIKTERVKLIEEYANTLLSLTERCADFGFKKIGRANLRTVRQLFKAPRSRRKLAKTRGVNTDAAPREKPKVEKVHLKRLRPKERALAVKVAARYKKLKSQLRNCAEAFETPEDRQAPLNDIERRIIRARRVFVEGMFRLADLAVTQGFPALGYEVLLWTLQFDPDNELRKEMRQYRFRDAKTNEVFWYGPFDYAKATSGYVDDPKLGWVTPEEKKELDQGLVSYKGEWHPKAFVEKEREDWNKRWVHETAHFTIHTNAPREDAVLFGREVERLYAFVFRVWVDYYAFDDPDLARQLVLRGGKDLGRKKLRLHYHRSRESYLWETNNDPRLKTVGNISLTRESAGFYWGGNGRAYFHRGPNGPNLRVIYHEVTHQIFGETSPDGPRPPVWMVEGIAVYMEDPVVRGEREGQRFLAGAEPPPGIRKKGIRDINSFIKTSFSDENFHGEERLDNYRTSGAVIHFFLLHRNGAYRRGFIRYAREAYRNTADEEPTPVAKLYESTGLTEAELQREWEAFNRDPALFDF